MEICLSDKTKAIIEIESLTSAHNYNPLPVVIEKGKDCNVWDVDGNEYLDFLSAYSATNHGHCHPRLISVMQDQCQKLTITSRAFYNSEYYKFSTMITELFGYSMVLPMNTGVEAVETGIKLARKWAYQVKGVPDSKAIILGVKNNFHGRTLGAISLSTDPTSRLGFGPFVEGITSSYHEGKDAIIREIIFNDIKSLSDAIDFHLPSQIAAFIIEPIQGEAGIQIPDDNYLREVQKLLTENGILLIVDEIQCGLGRAGSMLLHHSMDCRADIVLLGKALSGGMYPISCVLANSDIMLQIKEGEHGSTYGGNPLASAIACESLKILLDQGLCERSQELGIYFLNGLKEIMIRYPTLIKDCRGRGLFCAIEIMDNLNFNARELCLLMMQKGILSKPTHSSIIRLTPPLTISKANLKRALIVIEECLEHFIAVY